MTHRAFCLYGSDRHSHRCPCAPIGGGAAGEERMGSPSLEAPAA